MSSQLLSMTISLFLLMDSIGNIPIFLSVLKTTNVKRHTWIIFRELVFALIIIIVFYFLGEYLLHILQVKEYTVTIAGGTILFIIALRMIFPERLQESDGFPRDREPLIVPLAIPLVAGPAVLAAVMLYSHQAIPLFTAMMAIIIAWIATTCILLCSSVIKKILGSRGIVALERLMGLLLTLIAIQMFLEGLRGYLSSL
ncbi:MAG: YhgN family NAAT transporter [Simkania sp.]|nr:YhgN family NAAT transporter [Simkania sp.]